ncbi:MAG: hypothetical protein LBK73_00360 [Treponema sp.]|jgi:hypothetical protein|nr:hypothetical protein [Treponema sp.]
MKKLVLIGLLVLLMLPIFSQGKDSRAPFQGIWYGIIYGEDKVIFIFIDDIFICNLDFGFSGHFSVEDQNLIMTTKYQYLNSGELEDIYDESETGKIQYVFSGDRLILVFDGEPITFSRDYILGLDGVVLEPVFDRSNNEYVRQFRLGHKGYLELVRRCAGESVKSA